MADDTYTTLADEGLFGAIGRHTISWAFVESAVEYMVFASHRWAGGDAIEPEMPWSLESKIKFLRKSFRRLPGFQPFAAEALPLLEEIKAHSDIRHDLIHGVVIQHHEGTGEAQMMRLLREKTKRTAKEFTINTADVLLAANVANKLGSRAINIGTRVVAAVAPED